MCDSKVTVGTALQTLDTEYTADSTEWCPLGNRDILLCGTYQLLKSEKGEGEEEGSEGGLGKDGAQSKVGRLLLFQLDSEEGLVEGKEIKWCPQAINSQGILGSVETGGVTSVFTLEDNDDQPHLTHLATASKEDSEVLNLSLDWSNRLHPSNTPDMAVSSTDGYITLYRLDNNGLVEQKRWLAHTSPWTPQAEAWICAYDCWSPSTLFTGGDEGKLKGWDVRTDCSRPTFINKSHQMGVCSIQSNIRREHWLATGSYDDTVRLWDTRNMKDSVADLNVGGGVWRIKWSTEVPTLILTACIYNGFHILDASLDSLALHDVAEYSEHESLAYGADWRAHPTHSNKTLAATCSFYDHTLKLWEAQLD